MKKNLIWLAGGIVAGYLLRGWMNKSSMKTIAPTAPAPEEETSSFANRSRKGKLLGMEYNG